MPRIRSATPAGSESSQRKTAMRSNAGRVRYGWTTSNWCGCAQRGKRGSFRMISADWVVPSVRQSAQPVYSSVWIGIDGYKNNSLIQVGTEQDYSGTSSEYYAWWEILPKPQVRIRRELVPGDAIHAVIRKLKHGKWLIRIVNTTRKWSFQTIRSYTGPESSAECIVESPIVNGRMSNIANFSPITFSECTVNRKTPKWKQRDVGLMVRNGIVQCVPRINSVSSFTVYRVTPRRMYGRRNKN